MGKPCLVVTGSKKPGFTCIILINLNGRRLRGSNHKTRHWECLTWKKTVPKFGEMSRLDCLDRCTFFARRVRKTAEAMIRCMEVPVWHEHLESLLDMLAFTGMQIHQNSYPSLGKVWSWVAMLPSIDVNWSMLHAISTIQPLMKDMRARADVSASWQRPKNSGSRLLVLWTSWTSQTIPQPFETAATTSQSHWMTSHIRREEEDEQAKRRPGDRDLQRTWDCMIDFCLAFRDCDL